METYTIPIQNVSCESCTKVLSRLLKRFDGATLEGVSADAKTLTIQCLPEDVEKIKSKLNEYHYLRSDKSISSTRFDFVLQGLVQGNPIFAAERTLIARVGLGVVLLYVLFLAIQFGLLGANPLSQKIFPVMALVPIGIGISLLGLFHAHLLKGQFTCSTGMMIGMSLGMMPGFMLGAVVGATNGMFVGSVVGMAGGMLAGIWAGKYVGVMGTLEGMMAGLMAGTMGAMLSVMMVVDNLVLFLYILFVVCVVMLLGLNYMIYAEAGPLMQARIPSWTRILVIACVVLIFIYALALFGPKSFVAWGNL